MGLFKKTYDISQFTNSLLNAENLENEIQAETGIVPGLSRTDVLGSDIDIWFKADLSDNEWATLSGIVAQHDGAPSLDDPINVVVASGLSSVEILNIPYVRTSKPDSAIFGRIYSFSVNICDPTTWYVESEYVDDQLVAVASGETSFQTIHGSGYGCAIIDLFHGKITEENLLVAPTGSYEVSVTVSGIAKTERECYEASGGDFEVDYLAGKINFFEPQYGEVRASFFHTPSGLGPIFCAAPPAGKKWIIDAAELQVSSDFEMLDTIVQNVFLTHPYYGRIKAIADVEYKRIDNFLDFTYGSYPTIPAFGGPNRGTLNDTIIMRWNYLTPLELLSSLEMELRSWSKHGRGCGGERFVVTIYGMEQDE